MRLISTPHALNTAPPTGVAKRLTGALYHMNFVELVRSGKARIGIVGLGYVGLPLALNFGRKGYQVLGLDVDSKKVDAVNAGRSYIEHIPSAEIAEMRGKKLLDATTDMSRAKEVDAIIICVPTPLTHHLDPDLTYVISTIEALQPHLREGQLVSLESTTYPGTTHEEIRPRIEKRGFKIGENFYLVFSPEREDPGNEQFPSHKIPKVVGGSTPACLEAGVALYGAGFETVVPVNSTQVAEFAKLLENIYRSVNIGLVNEMKIVADKMGIDIWEVISAAATKPFGFKEFHPGPGLGGHCIPIDPFYLTWKAKEYGVHTRFIELAGEINEHMPEYVVRRTMEVLNTRKRSLNGSRILIMGLAYKANVDDMRESPSFKLLDMLKSFGAEVAFYDPHIPVVAPTREHKEWTGHKSVTWDEKTIRSFDAVIISTHHRAYKLDELAAWSDCIIDTRNAMAVSKTKTKPGQVTKA